jgi:hypothetical protein
VKRLFIILLSLFIIHYSLFIEHLNAQSYLPIELQFFGGGGLSDIYADVNASQHKFGVGGQGGVGFGYFFTPWMGMRIGVEYAQYNNSTVLAEKLNIYGTLPGEGLEGWYDDYQHHIVGEKDQASEYHLRTELINYTEKVSLSTINTSFGFTFQSLGNKKYYATVGYKIAVPIPSVTKCTVTAADIHNHAYYPFMNNTLEWQQTQGNVNSEHPWVEHHSGYGLFYDHFTESEFEVSLSHQIFFETGMKFDFGGHLLYVGVYVDYGVNDIRKSKTGMDFVNHKDGEKLGNNFTTNSLLLANQKPGVLLTEKVFPLAAGLKITYGIGFGKQDRKWNKTTQSVGTRR